MADDRHRSLDQRLSLSQMNNGAYYPTNWDIQGYAQQVSKIPSRAAARGHLAQRFADPTAVFASFDHALPGSRAPGTHCGAMDISTGTRASTRPSPSPSASS